MSFENWIFALLGAGVALAIYLTTPPGKRLADRFGIPTPGSRKDRAPAEDFDYLLSACDNDPAQVAQLLSDARKHNPEMTEAEAYRKAIRRVLR